MRALKVQILYLSILFTFIAQAKTDLFLQKRQQSSIAPVWYSTNMSKKLTRKEKVDKFRTICNQLGSTENTKIPAKTSNICRIMTYNVHFWKNPYTAWGSIDLADFYRMIHVIKLISPDILILQEVGGNTQNIPEFNTAMQDLGFAQTHCCSISEHGVDASGNLYNCIASKFPLNKPIVKKQYKINPDIQSKDQNPEQRCFIGASITLPNEKTISVYGTHLEVRPIIIKDPDGKPRKLTPETARKAQLMELVSYINQNDTNENIIIGADFNGFRRSDLESYKISNKSLWSILQENWTNILKEMDIPSALADFADQQPPSFALDYLTSHGYLDAFELIGSNPPQFTTWTGTRIDFLFLNPKWQLPIAGAYVFYSWASDHIPVIVDIKL